MSAENGIGTAGRLHAVEEPPKVDTGQRAQWPKGGIPIPHIKRSPQEESEMGQKSRDWRGILSTIGEIIGISGVSAGCYWFSPGIGLIAAGVGVFAVSFVSGMPE